MGAKRYVVVGAGPAGVTAAESLRDLDPTATVTLVGNEALPPYARMAIPYVLANKIDERGTRIRSDEDHYRRLGIDLHQGKATAVDAAARRLVLDDGAVLPYDKLLVATGSSPSRPNIPGLDLPGVHACWTLEDCRALCDRVGPGKKVVMLGAGFVACIILKALVDRGADVTVVCGSSGRMVRSMMDETAGGMIMRWCEAHGVKVMASSGRPTGIAPGLKVTVQSGETVTADTVVVATGVKTNAGFLTGSGVQVEEGIVVDSHMRTTVPDIFAAGDVAQGISQLTGKSEVHAIQPVAVEHGRCAALNMVGRPTPFVGSLAMNTLDTLGLISCSFGLWMGQPGGEQGRVVDEAASKYLRLEFADDRLIGFNAVGWDGETGIARGLIQTRVRLGGWLDKLKKDPWRLSEAYLACAHGTAG